MMLVFLSVLLIVCVFCVVMYVGAWVDNNHKGGCEDLKRINLLASELALRGGWHTTGFPLTCHASA